jgi:hypothetical protein
VVVVGEAVREATVRTLVVGEDVVGETVGGEDIVGEIVVGETVVGEMVVGDAVVGDAVGEAVLIVTTTMGSLTVTAPKVSTSLTAANTSAGLAEVILATNSSAFACVTTSSPPNSLASNVINVSTTTLPATTDRISTCNAVRHHGCEKVGHANTRGGDSNRSIWIFMWSHLGPLNHKVEWINGNRP